MLHLPAVAVGAPQVPRFVVALPSLLVHVTAADPGHMHCCRLLAHTATIGQNIDPDLYDTPTILATLRRPRQIPIPGEGNDPYSELRQLRARATLANLPAHPFSKSRMAACSQLQQDS